MVFGFNTAEVTTAPLRSTHPLSTCYSDNKILTESEMYEMSENDHNLHSKKPLGMNGVNHGGNIFPQICNRHLEK